MKDTNCRSTGGCPLVFGLVGAAALAMLALPAQAAVLIDETFNSDTGGSFPSAWTRYDGSAALAYVTNNLAPAGGPSTNSFYVQDNNSPAGEFVYAALGFAAQTNARVRWSFDVNPIANNVYISLGQDFDLNGLSFSTYQMGTDIRLATNGFGDGTGLRVVTNAAAGNWYRIQLEADLGADLVTRVRGIDLANSITNEFLNFPFTTPMSKPYYNVMWVRTFGGGVGEAAIANITLDTIVPEPSTLLLLSLGGFAVMWSRRRLG